MRKNNTLNIIFLIVILITMSAGSASAGTIKVCAYNFYPLIFQKDKTADGFFADIIAEAADREGWSVEYVPDSWPGCLEKLEKGEVDLLPAIVKTPERSKKYDFTSDFLFMDWGVLYQRPNGGINTFMDIRGKRVAALKNDIYEIEFVKLMKSFDVKFVLIEKDEYEDVLKAVESGEADVGVCGNANSISIETSPGAERTHLLFAPEKIRLAVKRGANKDLLMAMDRTIERLKEDKTSIYYKSFNRWMNIKGDNKNIPLWAKITAVLIAGALAIALMFVSILKRTVDRRTRELQATAESLKFAKEYAENIIETANTIVVGIDALGNITTFNRAAERITGYTKAEMEGKNWFEMIVPRDRYPEVWSEFLRLTEGGLPRRFENPILTKSGEEHYIVWSNSHIYEQGLVVGTISFGLDITDRQAAENAALRSARINEMLMDSLPYPAMLIRKNRKILACNSAARNSGAKVDSYCWQSFGHMQFISEEDMLYYDKNCAPPPGGARCYFCKADECFVETGGYSNSEIDIEGRTLDTYWIPLDDEIYLHFAVDITDRKLNEEKVRESEEKYRSLMKSAPVGIIMTTLNGKALEYNDAALEILGLEEKEMRDFNPAHIFQDNSSWNYFLEVLHRGGDARGYEKTLAKKDGSTYTITINASLLTIGGRGVILSVIQDITRLKSNEAALKENEERMRGLAQKLISAQEEERARIASGVHDQIGRVVTSLSLELGWMKKMMPEKEATIAPLQEMISNASGEIRRICAGLRPEALDRMGLSLALKELVGDFRRTSRFDVEESICEVETDSVDPHTAIGVYRVLQEALNNVAKHSNAKRVSISLIEKDSSLTLEVADDGVGISDAAYDGLQKYGLIGMKERASICGGILDIISEPGKGVRIRMTAPMRA